MKRVNFWKKLKYNLLYLCNPHWDTGISPPELIHYLDNHSPGRALDLGCGTGTNLVTMVLKGWSVVGVDFVEFALIHARKKLAKNKINGRIYNQDVSDLGFLDEEFDFILDIGCYHALDFSSKLLYEEHLIRILQGDYLIYGFLATRDNSFGITQADIDRVEKKLNCIQSTTGVDNGEKKSIWMLFSKR